MSKQSIEKQDRKSGNQTGFKKILDAVLNNLWIVVLDIVAVNAAQLLTLLIRAHLMGTTFAVEYYPALRMYVELAPFYTVLCVAVFALCRLYNSMWRYAGINDMNRIILASAITTAIHIAGLLLVRKGYPIPRSFPVFSALFQFVFVTLTRFTYRFVVVEQRMIALRKQSTLNAAVVGANESARKAIRFLEDSLYQPACIIDSRGTSGGMIMDGVPVVGGLDQLEKITGEYAVRLVVVSDPQLSPENRERIMKFCEANNLHFQDYSGFLANLSGRLPLTALLEIMSGPVVIHADGKVTRYAGGTEALAAFNDQYTVTGLKAEGGNVCIALKPNSGEAYKGYEAWVKKHEEETGEEVSYF